VVESVSRPDLWLKLSSAQFCAAQLVYRFQPRETKTNKRSDGEQVKESKSEVNVYNEYKGEDF
jgi:hypothetical protein